MGQVINCVFQLIRKSRFLRMIRYVYLAQLLKGWIYLRCTLLSLQKGEISIHRRFF